MAKTNSNGRLVYIEASQMPQTGVFFSDGVSNDNVSHRPEDLSMSVDLQVIVPKITDKMKAKEGFFDVTYSNGTPKYISFLQGSKIGKKTNAEGKPEDIYGLTDSYTEITSTYSESGSGARGGREHLGINSIDINFNSQFFPVVKMSLTDVRGSGLMCPAEMDYFDKGTTGFKNFYSALFHFPYPRFLLTIKGFYGNKITFILAVEDVKTELNAETGNFDVNISFIGYMYGLYTDIPFTLLLAAPYIGGLSENNSGKLETNAYWNEKKEFCFANSDGSNGPHICTFIEYLEKYQQVIEKINKGDIVGTRDLSQYLRKKNELAAFEELKKRYDNSLDAFNEENKNIINFSYTSDEYFSIYFSNKNEFLINEKTVSDFFMQLSECKQYDNIKQTTWKEGAKTVTGEKALGNAGSIFLRFTDNSVRFNSGSSKAKEIYNRFPNDTREDRIKHFEEFINSNLGKITENTYFFILWKDNFSGKIADKCNELEGKINESLTDAANEDLSDSLSAALGFRPSLENVFRMIFAHLDTFIHFVNKTVDEIDENRKLSDYLTVEETNISSKGILPPFFGYYTKGKDNKREFTYPGKCAKMRSFPEVQLVEDICNGLMGCYDRVKTTLNAEAAETDDEQSNSGEALNNNGTQPKIKRPQGEKYAGRFIPTMMTDIFREANPYSEYSKDQKEFSNKEDECALIYYYFYSRIISGLVAGRKIDDNFIYNEAKNFHDANPELRRNIFEVLKDSGNAYKRLCAFIKAQGNDFLFRFIGEEERLPFTKGNTPIVYKSPLRRTQDNILKWDENVEKPLPFNIAVVKSFASHDEDKDLNIDTHIEYSNNNYGRLYYSKTNGETHTLEKFKKKKYLEKTYNEFLDWVKENYGERFKECNYPLVQLGGNDRNVENLFYDEDFKKLGETENGIYKQGLLFLAALYNSDTYDNLPKKYDECYLKGYPTFYLLYLGGIAYRKETKIFTDDKEFFKTTKSLNGSILDENAFLSKDSKTQKNEIFTKQDLSEFKKLFTEWCDGWFKALLDKNYRLMHEYRNFENSSAEVWTATLFETKVPALLKEIETDIKQLYLQENCIGEIRLTYKIGTQSKMNIYINNFAKTLYGLYNDSEKESTGAANDEKTSNDDETAKISYEQRTNVYYTLSNLYTKWLVTFNEKSFSMKSPKDSIAERKKRFESPSQYDGEATEYGNFLFLDSYQNDISQSFFVNPEKLYDRLKEIMEGQTDQNTSIFQFMSVLANDNKLLFLSLPVYNNFYDEESLQAMFSPQSIYGENSKNTLGYGNTYILMYTHEVSKFLDSREEEDVRVADDKIDMADTWGNIYPESLEYFKSIKENNEVSLSVPAFGVTYGKQNQGIFKGISLNMDTPQVTDYSILNQLKLAEGGAHGDSMYPRGIGQDMYAIFSNRSYTCTVEMMGCMNIMPMMYFQLNNVPMFKGAYMIINVEHHIKAGDMTTKFTGVRISKNQLPFIRTMFNLENILDKISTAASNGAAVSKDDTGRIVGADDTFGGESHSTSTSPNGLQRGGVDIYGKDAGEILWDENGELIIPKASKPKCEFNVVAAIRRTEEDIIIDKGKGDKVVIPAPSKNTEPQHYCATAVKEFLIAGGIDGWSGANGAYCYNKLADRGFGVYTRGLKDEKQRLEWIENYAQAGDIALMEIDNGYGHICMYDGINWISDFRQREIWVYGKTLPTPKSDIIIMRYTGVRRMPNSSIGSNGETEFWSYAGILKEIEGGYSNIQGDSGGETVSGITQTKYQEMYGTNKDVKDLTESQWGHIMKTEYWDKMRCDEINNQTVANLIADWAVNSGTGTACKQLSAMLGLDVHYKMKDQAIEILNDRIENNTEGLINEIAAARRSYYNSIASKPGNAQFLEGWLKRIDTIIQKS